MKLITKTAARLSAAAAAVMTLSVSAFAEGEATAAANGTQQQVGMGAMLLQLVPFAAALVLLTTFIVLELKVYHITPVAKST